MSHKNASNFGTLIVNQNIRDFFNLNLVLDWNRLI